MSDESNADVLEEETTSEEGLEGEETPEEEILEHDTGSAQYKFTVDGKTVEIPPEEFERFYKDWTAEQKWQKKLHEKGEKLNKLRDEIIAKEQKLKEDEQYLNEWKKLRTAIEANPQAYQYINKLLNEQEPSLDPQYKKLESKFNELDTQLKEKEAIVKLSKKYEDFDPDTIKNFHKDIDWTDHEQIMEALYWSWKGSQIEDIIEKERAKVVMEARKKKGLPPTGKREGTSQTKYKNFWEAAEAIKKQVSRGEII